MNSFAWSNWWNLKSSKKQWKHWGLKSSVHCNHRYSWHQQSFWRRYRLLRLNWRVGSTGEVIRHHQPEMQATMRENRSALALFLLINGWVNIKHIFMFIRCVANHAYSANSELQCGPHTVSFCSPMLGECHWENCMTHPCTLIWNQSPSQGTAKISLPWMRWLIRTYKRKESYTSVKEVSVPRPSGRGPVNELFPKYLDAHHTSTFWASR